MPGDQGGRQPCGGAWGLHRGGRERERKGASAQSLHRLFFPQPVLSPPHSPAQACQGRMQGGAGAPVSLELESSLSFINMQISKF